MRLYKKHTIEKVRSIILDCVEKLGSAVIYDFQAALLDDFHGERTLQPNQIHRQPAELVKQGKLVRGKSMTCGAFGRWYWIYEPVGDSPLDSPNAIKALLALAVGNQERGYSYVPRCPENGQTFVS